MNTMSLNLTLRAALGLAAWIGGVSIAVAGQPEAAACAALLPPTGQMMFHAVSEFVKPDSDIAALMRAHVKPLVVTGRLSREDAERNARPTGQCLLLLKK